MDDLEKTALLALEGIELDPEVQEKLIKAIAEILYWDRHWVLTQVQMELAPVQRDIAQTQQELTTIRRAIERLLPPPAGRYTNHKLSHKLLMMRGGRK